MLKNLFTAIFLVIFCIGLVFVATSKNNSSPNKAKQSLDFDKELTGIARVVDGDSIFVDKNEIRLFGLDAPEYRQTCFNAKNQEYDCGKLSTKFLKKLINGKKVSCFYAEKDVYNRFLAKCFLGKISINHEIVKNGMAVIYDFNVASDEIIKIENQAKIQKLGIWQGTFELPKQYRKRNK